MAEEIGKEAIEKQLEIMQEQQEKAQEFIDQKVFLSLVTKILKTLHMKCTFLPSYSLFVRAWTQLEFQSSCFFEQAALAFSFPWICHYYILLYLLKQVSRGS